jgi:hypothetical protein
MCQASAGFFCHCAERVSDSQAFGDDLEKGLTESLALGYLFQLLRDWKLLLGWGWEAKWLQCLTYRARIRCQH